MSLINKDIDGILIKLLSIKQAKVLCQVNTYYRTFVKKYLENHYNFFKNVRDIKLQPMIVLERTLIKAIITNNIDVCKYLVNECRFNVNVYMDYTFQYSCNECCNLDMAKWLYSVGVLSRESIQSAFSTACRSGRLNVAQWLFSLGNIDIHIDDEYAFRWSCSNGKLDVAKWLHSIGNINIHDRDNDAFKWSCIYNRVEVAEWLCTLYSGYCIEFVNNKIKYYIY